MLSEDSPCPKIRWVIDSPIPKFIYLKIRRRDGVESLTILEEGEYKVAIDGCIKDRPIYISTYAGSLYSYAPTNGTTDASGIALGAVLSQVIDNVERPVVFASKTLSNTESKYSTGEREALVCNYACEHWHVYLCGRKFTLRTDHQALTSFLATSGFGHRPLRIYKWSDRLHQYNFDVAYIAINHNKVADMLSRCVTDTEPCEDMGTEDGLFVMNIIAKSVCNLVTQEEQEELKTVTE